MELVTVGTGTVAPSATRTAACHWVSRGRLKILLDCGAGALHRLAEFGLPWHEITHVVLSHFHPDHWGELPMLVRSEEHTSELQSRSDLVCRLLLEKKKPGANPATPPARQATTTTPRGPGRRPKWNTVSPAKPRSSIRCRMPVTVCPPAIAVSDNQH